MNKMLNEQNNDYNEHNESNTNNEHNNNLLFDKILNICTIISNDINKLNIKVDNSISKLEERILRIENKLNEDCTQKNKIDIIENLVDIKKEFLNIDKKDVYTALKYNDYRSFIYIIRIYYKNKTDSKYVYPIKIISARSFEYYLNGKWNKDIYGKYITDVLCFNIQNLFIKYNILNENINMNDLLSNQIFISKLSNPKYQKELFKHLIEEVRINNT